MKTCDHLRSQVAGLSALAGFFVYASVEAAVTELSLLLTERERELGSSRISVVYGHQQDPALDRMAKTISSVGLDTRPKNPTEYADIASWFPEIKPTALLFAWAEDDRFTGRTHDVAPMRAVLFGDGLRIPVLSLSFGANDWRKTLPRPYEIRVCEVSWIEPQTKEISFAAFAVVGERLRLEPRLAPLAMDPARLKQVETAFLATFLPSATGDARVENERDARVGNERDARVGNERDARVDIEQFEASVPKPFRAWWPGGSARRLDRAIVTSSEHDGSWLEDRLRVKLAAAGVSSEKIAAGLFSLSGCAMGDERRQEWLRSRGDDAWLIRGAVHISLDLIQALPLPAWLSIFAV